MTSGALAGPRRARLAFLILAAWAGEYVADVILGIWSVKYDLPLQLTDLVSLVSVAALLYYAQGNTRWRLVELVYFWGLSASLQAVLTPDLAYNFPSVFYFTYFGYHIGAILAGLVFVFGLRMYPRPGAVARVYAASLAWVAVAGAGDLLTGPATTCTFARSRSTARCSMSWAGGRGTSSRRWRWRSCSCSALSAIAGTVRRLDRRGRSVAADALA